MGKDLASQRREEILAAATRCFVRNGIHASGMSAIAKEFGMSAAHIYNYFPSKASIIEEIVSRGLGLFYDFVEDLLAASGDYEAILARLRKLFSEERGRHYFLLSLDVLLEARREPTLEAILTRMDGDTRDYLRKMASAIGQKDTPEAPIDARIEIMLATLEGLGLRYMRHPEMDVEAVCRMLARMIVEKRL